MDSSQQQLLLIVVPVILTLLVQSVLMKNYNKYASVRNKRNISGYEVARRILDQNGLQNVEVYQGEGQLSDYYDPTKNLIKLSPRVYSDASIASAAIAAHEVGHAIQYATKYPVIGLRNKLLPATIAAGNVAWTVIMIGLFTAATGLLYIGVILLGVIALFQLVTLPLEFNASTSAMSNLQKYGLLEQEELGGARKVLTAAALTYVAALLTTLIQILRIILLNKQRRN